MIDRFRIPMVDCRSPEEKTISNLQQQTAEQAAVIEKLKDALEKLACLGNGDTHGNSTGNCIAIDALTTQPTQSRFSLSGWIGLWVSLWDIAYIK